jgi:hypothetical protein
LRTPAPDFTQTELRDVALILQQRYGAPVPIELADSEVLLDQAEGAMTECPTVYWRARGAQFVVFKVADARFRCQFFYADADHYGTGRDEYDDLATCVLTLLRVQADHERDSAEASSGATTANLDDGEYQGPAIL